MGGVEWERPLGVGLTPSTLNHQEKPPRPARGRLETDLLFAWLEDALGDPIVDTHEFLAAVGRLAELLEHPTFSPKGVWVKSASWVRISPSPL